MLRALRAEVWKLRRSNTPLWTALVVLLAPAITASTFNLSDASPARMSWESFMRGGPQLMASWYGILLFGMVAAYLFGREYGEGTAKEMLTLPIRRECFFAAKMLVLAAWVLGLTLLSLVAQAGYAAVLGLEGFTWSKAATCLVIALEVALLIYATLPWAALLAMIGRGYLAPMVYSALAAFFGLGLAEAGWSRWFPWSMSLSVTGVALFPSVPLPTLVFESWALMAFVFVAGSVAAVLYMDRADSAS
jgi:ABC-2 type transport system permease protein